MFGCFDVLMFDDEDLMIINGFLLLMLSYIKLYAVYVCMYVCMYIYIYQGSIIFQFTIHYIYIYICMCVRV
ncbi:hypothetical protein EYC84_006637 [Monilinia fructicola]|uniref:Uncharacterized protein n=1 Tax=Monilinia fructicola TaxID=38448 RepID=A0A5M9K404_MONFR|nr:hypothetical protein EYC84_006637 [Monilinia fructicola]